MAFVHYADLRAQNYRAGYLHLVVVLCDNRDKVRYIRDKRKSVTCAECIEKLRDIPEVPEDVRKIDLSQAMLSGRAVSHNPVTESPERLADGAPITNVSALPDHRPSRQAPEAPPGTATVNSTPETDGIVVFDRA